MSTDLNPLNIVSLIKSVVKGNASSISLHSPSFLGREWEYLKDCLDTGWVSSVGRYVEKFEAALTCYTETQYAIATVNGTAALHICLLLSGVSEGDEVLMPALTFVATANAVKYCKAVPHFIDSDENSLGVDVEKLRGYLNDISIFNGAVCVNKGTMRPIRALVAMHTFGHPVDLDPLLDLCEKYGIVLIEDAAEALGSLYKGRHVGNHGRLSSLSFNGNKIVTTGGGGAILTNDLKLAKEARHLTTTAKVPHDWAFIHDKVGYNYRLPNINAALGCAQMERLELFVNQKRALAERYQQIFEGINGVKIFKEQEYSKSNYWLNALLFDKQYAYMRDKVLSMTNNLGLATRPVWTLMNKLPMFKDCPRMDLSTAESLGQRIINIPSSAYLGEEYVKA